MNVIFVTRSFFSLKSSKIASLRVKTYLPSVLNKLILSNKRYRYLFIACFPILDVEIYKFIYKTTNMLTDLKKDFVL